MVKRFLIGSDHAGFKVKEQAEKVLLSLNIPYEDFTLELKEGDDYSDVAFDVAKNVSKDSFGLLVCGTGLGMSISANKVKGVRAALCTNVEQARLARAHNDANVLVLGNYKYGSKLKLIVKAFFETKFDKGRHVRRVNKIKKYER